MDPWLRFPLQQLHGGLPLLVTAACRLQADESLTHELEILSQGLPQPPEGFPPLSPHPRGDLLLAASAIEVAAALQHALAALEQADLPADGGPSRDWIARARRLLQLLVTGLGQAVLRAAKVRRLRGLYVIADPSLRPEGEIVEAAIAALHGGACALQWRDKRRDKGDQLPEALRLAEHCHRLGALFIVNDHADLAVACQADGLHVGQHDLPIAEARRVLHPGHLVGRSNALVEEALESQRQGADYIAVGAMFPTTTKANTRPARPETLRRVKRCVSAPVVAIGGITEENVAQVVQAGADAICVTRAVISAPDPERAARGLLERMHEAGLTPAA